MVDTHPTHEVMTQTIKWITLTKPRPTAETSRTIKTEEGADLLAGPTTITVTTKIVTTTATIANAVYPGRGTTEARTASTTTSTVINPSTTTALAAHRETVAQAQTTTIKTLSTQQDMEHQTTKIEPPDGHPKIINNEHPPGVMLPVHKTKEDDMNQDLDNQPETLEKDQQDHETEVPAQDEYTHNCNLELPALRTTTPSK